MSDVDQRLLRVGVFYDGNFFAHVSDYYRYEHSRGKRISIPGIHEFIRYQVSAAEGVDVKYCHIVDAHFFRGRFSAKDAESHQQLYSQRVFDDILMGEGIVTHYLPMRGKTEKGIDVWLALESFELAVYKRFNVLVLIAGDSDFIPLARKLNSLGTRVMVLGWDFKFKDAHGKERETVTSINLLAEVTYPVMMNQIIDDKTKRDDQLVKNLFFETRDVPKVVTRVEPSIADPKQVLPDLPKNAPTTNQEPLDTTEHFGELLQPKPNGFGFIKCKEFPDNVFYSWSALRNMDFKELQQGQKVKFGKVERNDDGLFTTVVDVLLPQKDSCESTK